jgi:UDP-N-acetylmuramoyl-tripeptide--D-alanyl-D-alanine ligase
MRPLLLSELAAWTGGRALGDAQVSSVTIDSRAINAGALFIALRGERVDGHDFLAVAAEGGASAALVERAQAAVDLPQLVVESSVQALARIAHGLRQEHRSTVLALTGSNGKTTVKALLHGILERLGPTWANAGNRNNEIGMPLALIDEPAESRYAIYEMGAGQPGDIAHLAAIAAPHVALVNNIGPAHLERMGSLLGIAQTKGAIYDALPEDGTAVINADDAFGPWFAQRAGDRRVLRFGLEADADLRAVDIRCSAGGSQFRLLTPQGEVAVVLALPGRHNLRNALAAAAMALAVEAPLSAVAEGLAHAQAVAGRQTRLRLVDGAELIDDSYNANPASVAAAIASLAQAGGETWLVLGDMLELGPQAEALHAAVGQQARDAGLGGLFGCPALRRPARAGGSAAAAPGSRCRVPGERLARQSHGARDCRAGRPPARGGRACCLSWPTG